MSTTAAASSGKVLKLKTTTVNPPAPPSGAGGPVEGEMGAAAVGGEQGGRAALATEVEALRQQVAAQGGEIKELKAELEPLKVRLNCRCCGGGVGRHVARPGVVLGRRP